MRIQLPFGQRGVTLLEIMVALAILSICFIPFMQAFMATGKGIQKTADYARATYLAQKVVEDVRYGAYNEDSRDFSGFLEEIMHGEDDAVNRIVPTDDDSEGSAFFAHVFDPAGLPADGAAAGQLGKFMLAVEWKDVTIHSDSATPDAALVSVTVTWRENRNDDGEGERKIHLSTVISKSYHRTGAGGGES